jgi:hypothetical protein
MGDRKRIGSLFCLGTNCAQNRTAIRTQILTHVDGPLGVFRCFVAFVAPKVINIDLFTLFFSAFSFS